MRAPAKPLVRHSKVEILKTESVPPAPSPGRYAFGAAGARFLALKPKRSRVTYSEHPAMKFVYVAHITERFEHGLADQTCPAGLLTARGVPQAHWRPDIGIVPFGHAEDGIETHASQRHAFEQQRFGFPRDLAQPRAALVADMTGFVDNDLAAIALPYGSNEMAQRQTAMIIVRERRNGSVHERDTSFPLVCPVAVVPDDAEVLTTAPGFRQKSPAEHVPGLEDKTFVEVANLVREIRPFDGICDPAEWIGVDDPSMRGAVALVIQPPKPCHQIASSIGHPDAEAARCIVQ
jgi:hypothetical protein